MKSALCGIRHPHPHRNHLLAAVDARQVAFGAHVVKEDDVAGAEGAFRAVAVGDGERAGQHEEPLSVRRRVPWSGPVASEAHHYESGCWEELGRFKRRGRRREAARTEWKRAGFKVRTTSIVDVEAEVGVGDEHGQRWRWSRGKER